MKRRFDFLVCLWRFNDFGWNDYSARVFELSQDRAGSTSTSRLVLPLSARRHRHAISSSIWQAMW
jgi:hypothetical protein